MGKIAKRFERTARQQDRLRVISQASPETEELKPTNSESAFIFKQQIKLVHELKCAIAVKKSQAIREVQEIINQITLFLKVSQGNQSDILVIASLIPNLISEAQVRLKDLASLTNLTKDQRQDLELVSKQLGWISQNFAETISTIQKETSSLSPELTEKLSKLLLEEACQKTWQGIEKRFSWPDIIATAKEMPLLDE